MDATATSKIESWDNLSFVLVVQLDRLEAVEPPVQPRRRLHRRSADLDRVQRRAAVRGDRLPARRERPRERQPRRHRGAGGADHRRHGQRERRRRRGRHRDRLEGAGRGPVRRRDRRLEQGQHEGQRLHRVHGARRATIEAADVLVVRDRLGRDLSTSTVIQVSIVSNTLTGLTDYVGQFADERLRLHDALRQVLLKHGQRVRAAADYGLVKSDPGSVYVYHGPDALIDLGRSTSRPRRRTTTSRRRRSPRGLTAGNRVLRVGTGNVYRYIGPNCRRPGRTSPTLTFTPADWEPVSTWEKVVLTTDQELDNFYPNIGNISNSNSRAIGILIVLNDVRAEVAAVDRQRRRHGRQRRGARRPSRPRSPPRRRARSRRPAARLTAAARCRRSTARSRRTSSSRRRTPRSPTARSTIDGQRRASRRATPPRSTRRCRSRRRRGDLAVSIALAFNTIGWAVAELPLQRHRRDPRRLADLERALPERAGRDVRVDLEHRRHRRRRPQRSRPTARSRSTRRSRTPPTRTASALYGANGMAIGGIIALNKVRSAVQRLVRGRQPHASTAPSTCSPTTRPGSSPT